MAHKERFERRLRLRESEDMLQALTQLTKERDRAIRIFLEMELRSAFHFAYSGTQWMLNDLVFDVVLELDQADVQEDEREALLREASVKIVSAMIDMRMERDEAALRDLVDQCVTDLFENQGMPHMF